MNELAIASAWQVHVARERIPDVGIAFARVAVAVGPAGIGIAVSSLGVLPLPVVSGAAPERPHVAIIAVPRPSVRLSPVVIAIVVAGGAAPSATRRVRVPLLVSGFVLARVEIKHPGLHRNQFPRGRTRWLQWAI